MQVNRVQESKLPQEINKQLRRAIKKSGAEKIIALLKDERINLNVGNNRGNTPLHLAAKLRKPLILRHLLNCGGNPCQENKDGNTPMHLFLRALVEKTGSKRGRIISEKELNLLGELINASGVNRQNLKGDTILHILAKYTDDDKQEITLFQQFFHSLRPDLSIRNKKGNAPLHYSAKRLHVWTITRLMALGANPNQRNAKGLPPFYMALKSSVEKMVPPFNIENSQQIANCKYVPKLGKEKFEYIDFKIKKPPAKMTKEKSKDYLSRFSITRDQLLFNGATIERNEQFFQRILSKAKEQQNLVEQQLFASFNATPMMRKKKLTVQKKNTQVLNLSSDFDERTKVKQEIAERLINDAVKRLDDVQPIKQEVLSQEMTLYTSAKAPLDKPQLFLSDVVYAASDWLSYIESLLACTEVEEKLVVLADADGMPVLEVQSADPLLFKILRKKMGSLQGVKLIDNNEQEPNLYIFYLINIKNEHLFYLKTHFTPEHVKKVLHMLRNAEQSQVSGCAASEDNPEAGAIETGRNYERFVQNQEEIVHAKAKGRILAKYASKDGPPKIESKEAIKPKKGGKNKKRREVRKVERVQAEEREKEVLKKPNLEPFYELNAIPIETLQKKLFSEERAVQTEKFCLEEGSIRERFDVSFQALNKIQHILTFYDSVLAESDENLKLLVAKGLGYYLMVFFESLHTTSDKADLQASIIASRYLIERQVATNYRNALRHYNQSNQGDEVINLARRLSASGLQTTLSSLLHGDQEKERGNPLSEVEFKGHKMKEKESEKSTSIADIIRGELANIEFFLKCQDKSGDHSLIAKAAVLKSLSDISASLQELPSTEWQALISKVPRLHKLRLTGNRIAHTFENKMGLPFDESAWNNVESLLKQLKTVIVQFERI